MIYMYIIYIYICILFVCVCIIVYIYRERVQYVHRHTWRCIYINMFDLDVLDHVQQRDFKLYCICCAWMHIMYHMMGIVYVYTCIYV